MRATLCGTAFKMAIAAPLQAFCLATEGSRIAAGIVLVDKRVLSGKSDVLNASKILGRCFESGKAGSSTTWAKILSKLLAEQ